MCSLLFLDGNDSLPLLTPISGNPLQVLDSTFFKNFSATFLKQDTPMEYENSKMSFVSFGHLVGDCVSPNHRLIKSCDFSLWLQFNFRSDSRPSEKEMCLFLLFLKIAGS